MRDLNAGLLDAIRAQDEASAAQRLAEGADPDSRDPEDGLTALMMAAGRSLIQTVRALLDAGADLYTKDPNAGATALHKACQGGSLAVARLLVERGAFVDEIAVATGHTALIEAIWFKHPDIVEYLLVQGAGVNVNTHYGFTLLEHMTYALRVNRIDQDKLERAAALVKLRQAHDRSQVEGERLMAAVIAGDTEVAKAQIAAGADIEARYPILNGFNDDHTPLLVACRDGHTEIVAALLRAGADVNVTEPTFGAVPLHKATYNGHAGITRMLAEQPGIDLDYQGPSNGYTPLHDAIWHGFDDCARVLVEAGGRLDLQGHDGKTPLAIATEVFGPEHELVALIENSAGVQV
ncbi:MAG: ankyrin repeat domain-containing protein [Chromatiales bacterium]|nr:ankyrin repeat domain-containing protein [Chromatiales bacterium]